MFVQCSVSDKQCRPWSDAAFCGVWSGHTLFAKVSLSAYTMFTLYIETTSFHMHILVIKLGQVSFRWSQKTYCSFFFSLVCVCVCAGSFFNVCFCKGPVEILVRLDEYAVQIQVFLEDAFWHGGAYIHCNSMCYAKQKVSTNKRKTHRFRFILRMRKVSSGPLVSIHIFCNIQWFC